MYKRQSLTIHCSGLPELRVSTDNAGVAMIHLPARIGDDSFAIHAGCLLYTSPKEQLRQPAETARGSIKLRAIPRFHSMIFSGNAYAIVSPTTVTQFPPSKEQNPFRGFFCGPW